MMPLPPPVFTVTPQINEVINASASLQQISNTTLPQGTIQNPGVILTTHGEDVPLEIAFGIRREATQANRPPLLPLFRVRNAEGQEEPFSAQSNYEELRQSLPSDLKERLDADEALSFRERDPDLIALDQSLHFEATRRALLKQLEGPAMDPERAAASGQNYMALPQNVKDNLLELSQDILKRFDQYLEKLGPNDPSFDALARAGGQMREALNVVKQEPA
jgi:hypothetical protein